jgi:hypothetical protein
MPGPELLKADLRPHHATTRALLRRVGALLPGRGLAWRGRYRSCTGVAASEGIHRD